MGQWLLKKEKLQNMTKEEKETHQKEKEREKWRRRKETLKEKKLNMFLEELTAIKDKKKRKKNGKKLKICLQKNGMLRKKKQESERKYGDKHKKKIRKCVYRRSGCPKSKHA